MYDTKPVEFNPFAGPDISLIAPATESQVEIWTSCLIGGDRANCAYNESFSVFLAGIFNTNAMLKALQDLVNRHQSLRMSFSPDGQNICVYKELLLSTDYRDLSSQTPGEQQHFITEYNRKNILVPFDLVKGPLFKAALFRLRRARASFNLCRPSHRVRWMVNWHDDAGFK